MLVVLASFRLPATAVAEARGLIPAVVAATRAESGCLAYDVAEDALDAGLFRVSEQWQSETHLRAHLAAPHMAEWSKARAGLGMTERTVKVFAVSGEVAL